MTHVTPPPQNGPVRWPDPRKVVSEEPYVELWSAGGWLRSDGVRTPAKGRAMVILHAPAKVVSGG